MLQAVAIFHEIIDHFIIIIHIGSKIHKQGGHIDPSSTVKQIV